ncbi:MAG TPA: multicopper oxidase [Candidatus Methylomirabilis sp.]|nr:multicopper oxidase [Candidatus Methylomirabilis sp.]HSB80522.1 multicopper oxidase [Candidatus Methylomirabilis sp.]
MRPQKIRLTTLALAAVVVLTPAVASIAAPLPGGSLDPLTIPKYVDPLPIPGVMPRTPNAGLNAQGIDYYEIAVRQFQQQVLSTGTGLPVTTVWSYGSVNHPGTFFYPAFSIEAKVDKRVRVKWMNQLVDGSGKFLPHLLPVDQTLHWANPPGDCIEGTKRTDCRGQSQQPYAGPVPVIVHLHGSHVNPDSDGFPEAWFLPAANNIDCIDDPGYPRTPSTADDFFCRGSNFDQIQGVPRQNGAAVFQYRNDQRATTLWFHDHSLGMTRTNVYAGPAGFYLLRGGADDLPSGVPGGLPGGAFEIPIVIQDRSFNADGSLFYPDSRVFFDGYAGPYIGDPTFASDVAPLHNPEFFGNTMVVNGKTWPFLNVEPRKYRFRFLNGSDSRFLILKFSDGNVKTDFTVIGTEGGFLPAPVVQNQLLIGPAERFDVIVDFSRFEPGATLHLLNVGPDEPFGGPFPASVQADANTTGQVMQIRVVAATGADTSAIPPLPPPTPVGAPTNIRQVSLNELDSALICVDRNNVFVPGVTPPACGRRSAPFGPVSAQLGTVDPVTGLGIPQLWESPITENPALGSTEEWEISNFTADAHPIHVHMVMFQVVNRQPFGGVARGPEPWETGLKDTVVSFPGEITRIRAVYDIAGLFVWHCHILSHEDNEMMRPYCVGNLGNCNP